MSRPQIGNTGVRLPMGNRVHYRRGDVKGEFSPKERIIVVGVLLEGLIWMKGRSLILD